MKRYVSTFLLTAGLLLSIGFSAKAQFRDQAPSPLGYTGPVIKTVSATENQTGLLDLFNIHNVKMQNSLEMSFGSFGGRFYNQDIFTNTWMMNFTPRLSGRFDISLAASPFGNGIITGQKPRVFIRNAELNYQLSKNSSIHLQFSEMPYGGNPYMPYGGGYYGYYGNPFYNPGYGY